MEVLKNLFQSTAANASNAKKNPRELVQALCSCFLQLKSNEKQSPKTLEDLSKLLEMAKVMIYGETDKEPKRQDILDFAQLACASELYLHLSSKMPAIEFEGKRFASQVFNHLLKVSHDSKLITVDYILLHPEILDYLLHGYKMRDTFVFTASMLRECLKFEAICRKFLNSGSFFTLFPYLQSQAFEVSSDAFTTLKEALRTHKTMVAEYLEKNYDAFFAEFNVLHVKNNYATRLQALKLLGEMLYEKPNHIIMRRFVNDPENLKNVMNALLVNSKHIQIEAFNVFKLFVANPNKSQDVAEILSMNKGDLLEYLEDFLKDKTKDSFLDDTKLLLAEINKLP